MSNNILTVESTKNIPVSEDEKQCRKSLRIMMTELGLLPPPYDSKQPSFEDEQSYRFSKHYLTARDFEIDKIKALDLINSGKRVPDSLYKKIAYTVEEVKDKYNNYYDHL